jgi:hypothetical protein
MEKAPRKKLINTSSGIPYGKTADEEFRDVMNLRLQAIADKSCCDFHLSSAMYVDGIRLACCAGTGSTCKIKELNFLMGERKKLCQQVDKLRGDWSALTSRYREKRQELVETKNFIAQLERRCLDLERRNAELEHDHSFRVDPNLGTFHTQGPDPFHLRQTFEAPKEEPRVTNVYNNILNVNFVGNDVIQSQGVKLLKDACARINMFEAAASLLEENPTPANARLLELKDTKPKEFKRVVIENLKPFVELVPEELKDDVYQGLSGVIASLGGVD